MTAPATTAVVEPPDIGPDSTRADCGKWPDESRAVPGACPDCGCAPDDGDCAKCDNPACPCADDKPTAVIPPWCPLPQGDQALRDLGF